MLMLLSSKALWPIENNRRGPLAIAGPWPIGGKPPLGSSGTPGRQILRNRFDSRLEPIRIHTKAHFYAQLDFNLND